MELQVIQSKIYEIRGRKVMLDFDLAELYGTETKRLKEAVRRNIERFEGSDFMFQLSDNEITELSRSQFATLNRGRGKNIKYAPFAFTELGVAMLSSIIHSKTAIEINRGIMRAFVTLRQYAIGYVELNHKLEDFMLTTNMQFSEIYQALTELAEQKRTEDKPRKRIGFRTSYNEDEKK
ncbi:MAG: ORF6N domain-containing protein [Prevotellaceae bacterium]|nr:ORF6N domain-containing protein [Prevotellaceae bacterium]